MKTTAQAILVIFFVLAFNVVLFASTLRFQLLDYSFWLTAFQKHSIYQNLAVVVKKSVENQVGKEGGNKNDVSILTDLLTPQNTADFVNINLANLLTFMNGKSNGLSVYLPVSKIPKNLVPRNIAGLGDQMTLNELGAKFNITGLDQLPLTTISKTGLTVFYSLIISASLLAVTLFCLYLSTTQGARFIAMGIAFIVSGVTALLSVQSGTTLQAFMTQNYLAGTSLSQVLVGLVLPPVIGEVLITWKMVGITLIVIGVILFFIKKSRYNTHK